MKCPCKLCLIYFPAIREIRQALPSHLKGKFDLLVNDWEGNAQDANYYRAILDGSWPTAKEHLLGALNKVKKRERDEIARYVREEK
jgi:hypothetical protein